MTTTALIEGIAAEITSATQNLLLPVEYQNQKTKKLEKTLRKVNVYQQYIPRDMFENDSYYPCVIVEWLNITDEMNGADANSTANVGISCGVYSYESDGWKDCFRLTDLIRTRLLTRRLIADKFRLKGDVLWETGENQPLPFFFTYATLPYGIYQPQEPFVLDRKFPPDLVTAEPKILKPTAFQRRVK